LKFNRENAPVVGQLIGNLFTVLVELIKAMAPVTAITLRFTTAMLGFSVIALLTAVNCVTKAVKNATDFINPKNIKNHETSLHRSHWSYQSIQLISKTGTYRNNVINWRNKNMGVSYTLGLSCNKRLRL
jgi:hypothetical protein